MSMSADGTNRKLERYGSNFILKENIIYIVVNFDL